MKIRISQQPTENWYVFQRFITFCAKADPTPDSAPVANVGRTVFAKNGRAFAAKPARNPRNHPQFSYCEQPDVCSFFL